MSDEDPEMELEAIHERVAGWIDDFVKSPQHEPLTETQKDRAPGIVRSFAEYSFTYVGRAPEKWNPDSVAECCIEVLPRKMSADPAFFQAMAPVLSAFFVFLAEKGLLSQARALAKEMAGLDEAIVAASQDERNWGPAKSFVMAAEKAGVVVCDQKAMQQFMVLYNQQIFARQRMATQEPFRPAAAVPPLAMPSRRPVPKVGRNDPCPCGSGKKFKKCCGR